MAYRYNPSLPKGYAEGDNGQIVQADVTPPAASVPDAPIVKRYVENAATTTPTAAPAPDALTSYYEGIKAQSVMPDEARRAALRSQAQQDVQTQISAINGAYATLISDERARQQKLAAQGAAQVSGIGRLSGLGGSSVQAARQGTQATLASEQERQAVAVLQAKQAQEEAAARGVGTASADQRFAQEQALASTAQGQYGAYLQSLVPKAPVEVAAGGHLVDPKTGKVIYDAPTAEANKAYTLSPGQKVYGADGALIAQNNSTENKMTTLSPGQVLVGADGKAIYTVPGDPKTYTLSEGQAVFDSTGKLITSVGGKPQTFTLSPGQTVYDATGKAIATAGAESKIYTLSPGESAFDSTGKAVASVPITKTEAPVTKDIGGVTKQWNPTTNTWDNPTGVAVEDKTAETVAALQDKVDLVDSLIKSPGLYGSVGSYGLTRWTPFTADASARQNFNAGVQQLISKDTLDALLALKRAGGTLGALSEQEGRMLQSAATKIGTWTDRDKNGAPTGVYNASKDDFTTELNHIKTLTQAALDRAKTVSPSSPSTYASTPSTMTTPNGQVYELGPDGTYYPKANGGAGTPVSASVPISTTVNIPVSSHLASVNNNPGNLRFVGQSGASQGQGGFAAFPTPQSGYLALWNDVKAKQTGNTSTGLGPNSTLKDLVYVYAPPGENDSALYVQQLATRLGIDPNTPIGRIDTNAIAREIARKESSTVIG